MIDTAQPPTAAVTKPAPSRSQPRGWTENSSDWDAPPGDHATRSPSTAPVALQAENLSLSYGKNQALGDISFTLYQGDTLGLLGLNGAGKSTLLKILAGALAPDTGTVHIAEHELFENTVAGRMELGYAPDKPAVYPEFRVIEFLYFIARMRRINRRSIKSRVNNVIERCALGDVQKRIIGNLSTGYQQRLNIAQALIHTPRVLILDEPTNGLDPVQLMEMRQLVTDLAPEQATIFSSHLLSEVHSNCNRVFVINQGKQVLDASLATLNNAGHQCYEVQIANGSLDLSGLPGVSSACELKTDHWLLSGEQLTEEHLSTVLATRGQQAVKIAQTDNYLETLFTQLTRDNKPKNEPGNKPGNKQDTL